MSGKPIEVSRRRYIPLLILAVLSIAALVVGVSVAHAQAVQGNAPAPATATATGSTPTVCQQPVQPASQEPWTAGDGSAEKIWQAHAQDLSHNYVLGQGGWIFWNDYIEDYMSQAVGRKYLTNAQLKNWHDYLADLSKQFQDRGIQFTVIITPSTSSIYPEQLPAWMQDVRGSTIMDQFMTIAGDLPVMDLRAPLLAAKPDSAYHLFSWDNSHWTGYGAYVGWKTIAACTNALYPTAPQLQVPAISGVSITGDYNEWASYGVPSAGADWAVPQFAQPMQPVTVTKSTGAVTVQPGDQQTDSTNLPLQTSVAQSWTGKSALIVRDSMGGGLSPFWQQAYSPTWQVGMTFNGVASPLNFGSLVDQYHPQVVVLQFAERHLLNAPPSGAGFWG